MKKMLLTIFSIICAFAISAQKELEVKHNTKGLYLEHKVSAKENFYSIGRLYNVHPKHIASFNSLDMGKGLGIGKMIMIPLSDTNFIQDKMQGKPVYYVVKEKENLSKISSNHNKVLLENLRQWNHLAKDDLQKGQKLVVGFLGDQKTVEVAKEPPVKKNEIDIEKTDQTAQKSAVPKKEETPVRVNEQKSLNDPSQKKEDPTQTPNNAINKEVITKDVKKPVPVESHEMDMSQGYFKASFTQQAKQTPPAKNQTVTSGIFKTESGWNDAKYYLLIDGLETGTIVKITNPANNKIIYAKVLGEMSGLANKGGLDIRVSNAAASVLEIDATDKFILKLNY